MIISDGGKPSNVDRGYILRRLIRRMIRHINKLEIDLSSLEDLVYLNIDTLNELYPELEANKEMIKSVIIEEKDKFVKTLAKGEKEFFKEISGIKEKALMYYQEVWYLGYMIHMDFLQKLQKSLQRKMDLELI